MLLTIETELDYEIEGTATLFLQIEAADLPDQRVIDSAIEIENAPDQAWQPADEGIGRRGWITVKDRFYCKYRAQVQIERHLSDIRDGRWVPLAELPPETVKFLMPSRYCQSDMFVPFVTAQFGELEGGQKIAAIRQWIEDNFEYVRGSSNELTTVVETFVKRQGVCRDYAHVMVTLARAAQFPARCVAVYAPDVEPPDFHAVAEVYVGDEWRLLDPTGMCQPDTMARMVVGHDAANIGFLSIYAAPGSSFALVSQTVSVTEG